LTSSNTLAGPDAFTSIAWRVNAERLVLLGWSRAILLQIAHPLIAEGVFDHSGFRASPVTAAARLHHTVKSMLALTFGDDAARGKALDGILAIHKRVNGRLAATVGPFPAGTPYSAEDPALVLWVHATLLDSIPLLYGLLVHPLTVTEHDAYCEDAAPIAIALGAREDDVPRSRASLHAFLDATYRSGAIAVGPHARELARAVMTPPGATLVAPAAWMNHLLTVGLLPGQVREQYGFGWSPRQARALAVVLAGLRITRHGLPDRLALWRAARPAG
jgi:uncharacterized protein (DUF2236 family)